MMMVPNLENLYAQRWYRDVLCMITPDEFLMLASKLVKPFESSLNELVTAMKAGKKITIPSLWIEPSGKITGHEGRHRSIAAKKVGIDSMLVIVHIDDRCTNLYDHEKYPNNSNMINEEIINLNDIRPPSNMLAKLLLMQKTKLKRLPGFLRIDKNGYGRIVMSMVKKERMDYCTM